VIGNLKAFRSGSRKSFSSLESEKFLGSHENKHKDAIMETYPLSCTVRNEKKTKSYISSQTNHNNHHMTMSKTENKIMIMVKRPEKMKNMEFLSQFEKDKETTPLESSMKSLKSSIISRHLPSLSLGERLVSESSTQRNLKEELPKIKMPLTSRDEYQLMGWNSRKFVKEKKFFPLKKHNDTYKMSNRASCLLIKKLKGTVTFNYKKF